MNFTSTTNSIENSIENSSCDTLTELYNVAHEIQIDPNNMNNNYIPVVNSVNIYQTTNNITLNTSQHTITNNTTITPNCGIENSDFDFLNDFGISPTTSAIFSDGPTAAESGGGGDGRQQQISNIPNINTSSSNQNYKSLENEVIQLRQQLIEIRESSAKVTALYENSKETTKQLIKNNGKLEYELVTSETKVAELQNNLENRNFLYDQNHNNTTTNNEKTNSDNNKQSKTYLKLQLKLIEYAVILYENQLLQSKEKRFINRLRTELKHNPNLIIPCWKTTSSKGFHKNEKQTNEIGVQTNEICVQTTTLPLHIPLPLSKIDNSTQQSIDTCVETSEENKCSDHSDSLIVKNIINSFNFTPISPMSQASPNANANEPNNVDNLTTSSPPPCQHNLPEPITIGTNTLLQNLEIDIGYINIKEKFPQNFVTVLYNVLNDILSESCKELSVEFKNGVGKLTNNIFLQPKHLSQIINKSVCDDETFSRYSLVISPFSEISLDAAPQSPPLAIIDVEMGETNHPKTTSSAMCLENDNNSQNIPQISNQVQNIPKISDQFPNNNNSELDLESSTKSMQKTAVDEILELFPVNQNVTASNANQSIIDTTKDRKRKSIFSSSESESDDDNSNQNDMESRHLKMNIHKNQLKKSKIQEPWTKPTVPKITSTNPLPHADRAYVPDKPSATKAPEIKSSTSLSHADRAYVPDKPGSSPRQLQAKDQPHGNRSLSTTTSSLTDYTTDISTKINGITNIEINNNTNVVSNDKFKKPYNIVSKKATNININSNKRMNENDTTLNSQQLLQDYYSSDDNDEKFSLFVDSVVRDYTIKPIDNCFEGDKFAETSDTSNEIKNKPVKVCRDTKKARNIRLMHKISNVDKISHVQNIKSPINTSCNTAERNVNVVKNVEKISKSIPENKKMVEEKKQPIKMKFIKIHDKNTWTIISSSIQDETPIRSTVGSMPTLDDYSVVEESPKIKSKDYSYFSNSFAPISTSFSNKYPAHKKSLTNKQSSTVSHYNQNNWIENMEEIGANSNLEQSKVQATNQYVAELSKSKRIYSTDTESSMTDNSSLNDSRTVLSYKSSYKESTDNTDDETVKKNHQIVGADIPIKENEPQMTNISNNLNMLTGISGLEESTDTEKKEDSGSSSSNSTSEISEKNLISTLNSQSIQKIAVSNYCINMPELDGADSEPMIEKQSSQLPIKLDRQLLTDYSCSDISQTSNQYHDSNSETIQDNASCETLNNSFSTTSESEHNNDDPLLLQNMKSQSSSAKVISIENILPKIDIFSSVYANYLEDTNNNEQLQQDILESKSAVASISQYLDNDNQLISYEKSDDNLSYKSDTTATMVGNDNYQQLHENNNEPPQQNCVTHQEPVLDQIDVNISPQSPISSVQEEKLETLVEKPIIIPGEHKFCMDKSNSDSQEESLLVKFIGGYKYQTKRKSFRLETEVHTTKIIKLRGVIEHYLITNANEKNVQKCKSRLLKRCINIDMLCHTFVEIAEDIKDKITSNQTPPAPAMTLTHKKMLILIYKLKSVEFVINLDDKLLEMIEYRMFNMQGDQLPLSALINLTLLYIGLIDVNKNINNPARLFICKCLYFLPTKHLPLISYVLVSYPYVLPHQTSTSDDDHNDVLVNTIKCVLNSTVYNMDNTEMHHPEIFHMMKLFYGYERVTPSREELTDNFIARLRTNETRNVSFALAILCKTQGNEWTESYVLKKHLLPLITESYNLILANDKYDMNTKIILESLSFVLRQCRLDFDISTYLKIFNSFIHATDRQIIQEAAICGILVVARFGVVNSYNLISKWCPDFQITPMTQLMMESYLNKRPPNFWKNLNKQ